jgi:hypothetical protein
MSTPRDELPVLTEILIPGQVPQAAGGPALTAETDAAWEALERDVREGVLRGLQGRLDLILEQRINDAVHNAVDRALADLSNDIKSSIRDSMREIVTRAVTLEISRLRATKIRPGEA